MSNIKEQAMITEAYIAKFLKEWGLINKNRYKGHWVLPRPLQPSFYLEERYVMKEKPETTDALARIETINARVQRGYGFHDVLLNTIPFGKTYILTINQVAIDKMNEYKKKYGKVSKG